MPEQKRDFTEFLKGLNEEELNALLSQLKPYMKKMERETAKKVAEEKAIKLRDKLKIDSTAYYREKKSVHSGRVVGINEKYIKVKIEGMEGQQTVKILSLITKEEAEKQA